MGLLDDAIREHLELKRRRGADPTEVERLEREALGPVRRGAQASEGVLLETELSGQAMIRVLVENAKKSVSFAAEIRPAHCG